MNKQPNDAAGIPSRFSSCPGEDVQAAFVEGRLSGDAKQEILLHMDSCEHCFEVICDAMAFHDQEVDEPQPEVVRGRFRPFSKVLALSGVAAAALVFFVLNPKLFLQDGNHLERGLYEARMAMLDWAEEGEELRLFKLGFKVDQDMVTAGQPRRGPDDIPHHSQHAVDAVEYFEAALAEEESETTREYLISMHMFTGQYARAYKESQALLQISKSPRAECYGVITQYFFERRSDPTMLETMRNLYRLYPEDPFIVYNSAVFFTYVEAPESSAAWQKFLQLEPEGPFAAYAQQYLEQNP